VGAAVDIGAAESAGDLVVTTASDVVDANDALVSLREAVTMANAGAGSDMIVFGLCCTNRLGGFIS
jgi:hypothetical protein